MFLEYWQQPENLADWNRIAGAYIKRLRDMFTQGDGDRAKEMTLITVRRLAAPFAEQAEEQKKARILRLRRGLVAISNHYQGSRVFAQGYSMPGTTNDEICALLSK